MMQEGRVKNSFTVECYLEKIHKEKKPLLQKSIMASTTGIKCFKTHFHNFPQVTMESDICQKTEGIISQAGPKPHQGRLSCLLHPD